MLVPPPPDKEELDEELDDSFMVDRRFTMRDEVPLLKEVV
jgi:hypothetical protein